MPCRNFSNFYFPVQLSWSVVQTPILAAVATIQPQDRSCDWEQQLLRSEVQDKCTALFGAGPEHRKASRFHGDAVDLKSRLIKSKRRLLEYDRSVPACPEKFRSLHRTQRPKVI